jgi:tetratricopeptide (TPR) repeat protein
MISLIVVAIASFLFTNFAAEQIDFRAKNEQKVIYVAPPRYVQHMVFGYNESVADSIWLRTIQDLNFCEKKTQQEEVEIVRKVEKFESITDEKMKFLIDFAAKANKGRKVCRKGWVFRMLDATTELAPRFRVPYEAGALALSVLIDDYEGAAVLFEKAVKQFPNDWRILYRAAYHFLFDQKDFKRAAELLVRAGQNGAPAWVKGLAATLYTTEGQLALALSTLEQLREGLKDDKQRKALDNRIETLKKQAVLIEKERRSKAQAGPPDKSAGTPQ